MKVESHWSVLKRHYLLPFNRPRVDLLIHIIDMSLMKKFEWDYESLRTGRKKPSWWKNFVKYWKDAAEKEVCGNYTTCEESFICSCPAWMRSQHFICKHLVRRRKCPLYHQVTIRRSPPFICIDENSNRVRANIDDEEFGYTDVETLEVCDTPNDTAISPPVNEEEDEDIHGRVELEEVLQTVTWMKEHVEELYLHGAGHAQLLYIHKIILPRMEKYKSDVEKTKLSRNTPKTWESRDTVYLP